MIIFAWKIFLKVYFENIFENIFKMYIEKRKSVCYNTVRYKRGGYTISQQNPQRGLVSGDFYAVLEGWLMP